MNGLSTYQENQVLSQNRGQLVVTLYEGAIKFLKQAVLAMDRGDYLEKGRLIGKALDIIQELDVTLNMEAGGEISQNLHKLYLFMVEQLLKANVQKDAQKIQGVVSLLDDLNQGWKTVAS